MLELCCTTHIWMNGLWCCSVLENYVAPHVFEWISCDATVSFLCIFMTEWVFCFRFWCTWAYCRNRVVGSLLKINLKVQWHIQLIILDSDRLGVNLPSLADHPVLGYSHIKVHRWWDNFCLSQSIHDNADAAGMIAVANSHLTISGTWGPCRKLLCLRDLLHVWFLVKQKVHWEVLWRRTSCMFGFLSDRRSVRRVSPVERSDLRAVPPGSSADHHQWSGTARQVSSHLRVLVTYLLLCPHPQHPPLAFVFSSPNPLLFSLELPPQNTDHIHSSVYVRLTSLE